MEFDQTQTQTVKDKEQMETMERSELKITKSILAILSYAYYRWKERAEINTFVKRKKSK